jgi:cytochrome c oxidase subunit 3
LTGRKGSYEIVETMGLYWHFVDLVWVFIFAVFYLW